jgi:hypothetical protein
MTRPLLFVLMIVLIAPIDSPGQVQLADRSKSAASSPGKVDPATEKKALDLLESVSDQIMSLRSSTNRLRAQCVAADLLWARNEKRARALFKGAIAILVNRIAELDYGDQESYHEIMIINYARHELVLRIAAHDPELAFTTLRQTRLQAGGDSRHNWYQQNEAALELNVANLMAAKDPARALELARETLTRGITPNLIPFLSQLHKKDPGLAESLYQDIVTRIKDNDLTRHPEAANNVWNLLTSFQPPQANEAAFRELLTAALADVMTIDRQTQMGINLAQNFYHQVEGIMPVVEKYAPSRAAELRNWAQEVERNLDPSVRIYQELNRLNQHGTVDDLLTFAAKQAPEYQNMLYQSAVWKALSAGDSQRAKDIAGLMPDPIQRRQTLDQIDNQLANAAENANRAADARRLVEKAKTVQRKIEILIQMANNIAGRGDKKAALELLLEAKTILTATTTSAATILPRLRLAQAYLPLDANESFALLHPLIAKLNEVVTAAAVLDGLDARYLNEGEWEMPGANNVGNVVNAIDQTLAALGRTDFDRARTLVEQIERPEIRVLMEIDLAQAVLSEKVTSPAMFSGRSFSGYLRLH